MSSPQATVHALLAQPRTWAIVGLSADRTRYAHQSAVRLMAHGHRVIPVNPLAPGPILNQPTYPTLDAVPEKIDVVAVYRRSPEAGAPIDEARRLGVPYIWLPPGVRDGLAEDRATAAGVTVLMDVCPLVELPPA